MKTTLELSDALLQEARSRAANERRSLASLIEEGLAIVLSRSKSDTAKVPISKAMGGLLPGITLSHSGEIWDVLDGV